MTHLESRVLILMRHTVTLAAQPLSLSTEAVSVITPDRAPTARRSLTVRFALSSDGSAERTFGGPQAALR